MTIDSSGESQPVLTLFFDEGDVDQKLIAQIKAESVGHEILGGVDTIMRRVREEIARNALVRIVRSVPEGFGVSEMTFKVALSGSVVGLTISGDVQVKIAPTKK